MSTVERPRPATRPPLVDGDRLDQPTFHERYEAMPHGTRAELIGGVVYLYWSPMQAETEQIGGTASMLPLLGSDHGDDHFSMAGLIFVYVTRTPGVRGNLESSTVLNAGNEVQPDCSLRILAEYGGQTRTIPKWIEGAPELVVEISRSSRRIDLGEKREEYLKAGVREYVVCALDPNDVFWHVRRGDQFVAMPAGGDGLFRSEAFPGLWLDPAALFRRDLTTLIAALDRGLASPEHAAFVAELARRRAGG